MPETVICYDYFGNPTEVDKSLIKERKSIYGVYIKDNKVLIVKSLSYGKWELPGGGVDEGETDHQALIRELKEETGLNVTKIGSFIFHIEGYYTPLKGEYWHTNRHFYTIEETEGEIIKEGNGEDTSGVRFMELGDIDSLTVDDMNPELLEVLQLFRPK